MGSSFFVALIREQFKQSYQIYNIVAKDSPKGGTLAKAYLIESYTFDFLFIFKGFEMLIYFDRKI